MNMKRLLSLVAFFATVQASAQQVNPVPDYVFANRMSAGRNTVTDTAAYFSIGPRYGATRGMMPPMVVDTASFSANKRNGLLIFSIQKNKFLYWDSVGSKWAEMAGTAGTALTSADTAALLSTRAWRQKGIDSLAAIRVGGSGTTNYVPKFTATTTVGNSQIFDDGTNVGIGTTSPGVKLGIVTADGTANLIRFLQSNQRDYRIGIPASQSYFDFYDASAAASRMVILSNGNIGIGTTNPGRTLHLTRPNGTASQIQFSQTGQRDYYFGIPASQTYFEIFDASAAASRMAIFSNGRVSIGSTSDAGDHNLQVTGNVYNTGSAYFAASSGNVGIGRSASYKLDVAGNARIDTTLLLGKGLIDNQKLIEFPTFDFVHRQYKNNFDGFNTDSASSEYILLRSIEGVNRQTMFVGDSEVDDKNIFGFSNSTNSGVSYTARFVINANGKIGIGTNSPAASSIMDVTSTVGGFLPPRMTTTQRDAISSPAAGLVIYNTTTSKLQVYTTTWTDLH